MGKQYETIRLARPAAVQHCQGMALDPRDYPVQEHQLSNGLQIRLLPDRALPIATLYSFFRVGSRNERPGITGISHLFEHMMFNGSRKYGPKEFDRRLEAAGGSSNAYTSVDLTVYHEEFAREALPVVLDLESDRMAALAINDESLKQEREVVKEERRFRTDNDLDGMMDEALGALAFQAHPYRWPVVGWMSDLNRITRQDCEEYFRTYYAPNNCTLILVGDFDLKDALGQIEKLYGPIPRRGPPPPVPDGEPPQKGERRCAIHFPAQAPALLAGFRTPRATDPDTLAIHLIEHALGVGEGGRLRRALVYGEELCVDAHVYFGWRIDQGLFQIGLKLNPGIEPARAEEALWLELQRVCTEPFTAAELQRAKNLVRAGLVRGLQTCGGRAHLVGQMEVMLGSWRDVLALDERYQAISGEQVQEAASKLFASHRRNLVTLLPGELPEGGEA
jgi:predicted Zn-dependent peptidase